MASKVMVKIPVAPFGQVNKNKSGNVSGEIIVARPQEVSQRNEESFKGPEQVRISQLEQNIKFLQEQHQLMLAGLHNEVEVLKNRNRELQFQLIFSKEATVSSPSSSSEDEAKHKVYSSPKSLNAVPLQVEILEKELGELKLQLQETDSRNVYLSAIVDEQKKKLERYERDREKERERSAQPDQDLLRKLDDAEAIIRRLNRENSDLRRENAAFYSPRDLETNGYASSRSSGHMNNRGHDGRQRGNGGHYKGNWFPALHSQSYWQGGRSNDRNNLPVEGSSTLPSLNRNEGHYHGKKGSNNNHYHHGEGRKYRGGQKNNSKQT